MFTHTEPKILTLRDQVVGVDQTVPLANGSFSRYINFDNAASTPTLQAVLDKVNNFMPWYSAVHRGSGFKSQVASNSDAGLFLA